MNIETLVTDIYKTIQDKSGWFGETLQKEFSDDLSKRLGAKLSDERQKNKIRLSGLGPKCPKHLWYSIHHPEMEEKLPPYAEIKYTYGEIIESMTLMLAEASGHEVTGRQDELVVDGVVGHRDAVIDGILVDIKSTSSYGFDKFKNKTIAEDDPFGYLEQLDAYLAGCDGDPLVRDKSRAFLVAVDKQLGHMCLYEHKRRYDILNKIRKQKEIIALKTPPRCECKLVPEGKSGNMKLDVKASYSPFKHQCFPSLRTFLYSGGPVYLATVAKEPNVTEVDKHGKIIRKIS